MCEKKWDFKSKKTLAFFRGAIGNEGNFNDFTRNPRAKISVLSSLFPKHLDGGGYYQRNTQSDKLLFDFLDVYNKNNYIDIQHTGSYKYLLSIDPNPECVNWVFGGRILQAMFMNCVSITPMTSHVYFSQVLEPFVHYVPVNPDFSDLIKKIDWLNDNPEKAEEIALNGYKFAHENLKPDQVLNHHIFILNQIAENQKTNIEFNGPLYPQL